AYGITLPDGANAYPAYDEEPGVVGRIRQSRHPANRPHRLTASHCRMALTLIRPTMKSPML
ncbi:hypothetical protein, partial [Kosakonia cowanii]|uniref:hypothetical protein n=1 Tax=Kosakonia cowanii TaxID=208223 RepID=UPI0028AFCF19